jgi:hypothetical protein
MPSIAAVAALRDKLRGPLRAPDAPDYDATRKVFNGMVNKYPALIARCTSASDVVACVNFARDHEVLLSVRLPTRRAPSPASNEVHKIGAERFAAELPPAYRRSRSDEAAAAPVPRPGRGHSVQWRERAHSSMTRSTNLECPDRHRITLAPKRVLARGAQSE